MSGTIYVMICTVGFDNLEICAGLGVYEEEQGTKRLYYIDGRFTYQAHRARTEGNLEHALDYASIAGAWKIQAESRHYGLLEELAGDLLDLVYKSQPLLESCRLAIRKPNAVSPGCPSCLEVTSRRKENTWYSIY